MMGISETILEAMELVLVIYMFWKKTYVDCDELPTKDEIFEIM